MAQRFFLEGRALLRPEMLHLFFGECSYFLSHLTYLPGMYVDSESLYKRESRTYGVDSFFFKETFPPRRNSDCFGKTGIDEIGRSGCATICSSTFWKSRSI